MPNLTPTLFFEIGALIKLYNDEVAAAQLPDSDAGEDISRNEKLTILIAVGGPFLQRFIIPGLPDEQVEAIAIAITNKLDRFQAIRQKAANLLDRAADGAELIVNTLTEA